MQLLIWDGRQAEQWSGGQGGGTKSLSPGTLTKVGESSLSPRNPHTGQGRSTESWRLSHRVGREYCVLGSTHRQTPLTHTRCTGHTNNKELLCPQAGGKQVGLGLSDHEQR